MKIRVTNVNTRGDPQRFWVAFSTVYGHGEGGWVGSVPIVGEEYEVELEIEEVLIWGSSVKNSKDRKPKVNYENDMLFICGMLENSESDGYTVTRLGDSLITFLAKGVPSTFAGPVEISVTAVLLYEVQV